MDKLVQSLLPIFVVGFSLQWAVETFDSSWLWITNKIGHKLTAREKNMKKVIISIISLIISYLICSNNHLRILEVIYSGTEININDRLDLIVSSIILASGTEGFNTIMKFLNYKKEEADETNQKAKSSATRSEKQAVMSA